MRALSLFAIGIVFGGLIGFLVAAGQGVTLDGHDHADPAHHAGSAGHAAHEGVVAFDGATAPTLEMDVTKDPVSGYNLYFKAGDGFAMAPDKAGQAHVPGEGHAHVYVNGTKIARLYGDWFHIPSLPAGDARVTVTINANDHRSYTLNGEKLSVTRTVTTDEG